MTPIGLPAQGRHVRHYSEVCRQCHAACFGWAGLKGHASRRHRVRHLPYAEAKDRGRRSRRHDGPLDPTPATVTRPAGRTRRTSPHRGRGISRRGAPLLPTGAAAGGPGRSLPGPGTGADEEQSTRRCCRIGPPGRPAATARDRVVHSAWRRLASRRRSTQSDRGV